MFEGANFKNLKLQIEIVGNTEIKIDNMHFFFALLQVDYPIVNQDFSPGARGPFYCLLCDDIR